MTAYLSFYSFHIDISYRLEVTGGNGVTGFYSLVVLTHDRNFQKLFMEHFYRLLLSTALHSHEDERGTKIFYLIWRLFLKRIKELEWVFSRASRTGNWNLSFKCWEGNCFILKLYFTGLKYQSVSSKNPVIFRISDGLKVGIKKFINNFR